MAKFIVGNNVQDKVSKAGKPYKVFAVKDEGGVVTQDVVAFTFFSKYSEIAPGGQIEGILGESDYQGKKSYSMKDGNLGPRPAGIPYVNRNAAVGAAMAQKEASIGKFQDNKEHSILVSGTARDATIILNALMQQGRIKLEGDEYKAQWIKIRYWLVAQWNNIEQPKVGAVDYPQAGIDDFGADEVAF